ncbi:MAG: diaminopimelate epimerase [Phycisphaeraceae bacterium]
MRFVKMHGLGNDYVYVNGFEERVDDPAALAPKIADRHFGVGGDGLILALPPEEGVEADVRMRMFNADGSEAEMCGNGVRCVCKLAHDHGLTTNNPMRVQTGAGVLSLDYTLDPGGKVDQITVDMGEPILEVARVPADPAELATGGEHEYILAEKTTGEEFTVTLVSMGNPHATIFVDDVQAVDLNRLGPLLETHPAFPNRMNVHFVEIHSPQEVTMRTWERGSGVTLACGTGASAVAVSGVLTGRTARKVLAHLPGGDLTLEYRESDGHLYMTGPATEVFTGEWPD